MGEAVLCRSSGTYFVITRHFVGYVCEGGGSGEEVVASERGYLKREMVEVDV